MGTLYNQRARQKHDNYDINTFLDEVTQISKKYNMEKKDVISSFKTLEIRRQNDLYLSNGDIYDEQIGGIGQEIKSISNALQEIAQSIEEK